MLGSLEDAFTNSIARSVNVSNGEFSLVDFIKSIDFAARSVGYNMLNVN